MKRVTRLYEDDLSQPDDHFLDVSKMLVESIRDNPYSTKDALRRDLLRECGTILRYRILVHNTRHNNQ